MHAGYPVSALASFMVALAASAPSPSSCTLYRQCLMALLFPATGAGADTETGRYIQPVTTGKTISAIG
jgi:hypothetical protein